jgi:hypothetical protein
MVRPRRILIANEPRAYRDALAAALQTLRPHVQALVVEPDDLDCFVERLAPDLVICSRASETVRARVGAWVMLYPDGEDQAVIVIGGQGRELARMDLEGILALVDALGDIP